MTDLSHRVKVNKFQGKRQLFFAPSVQLGKENELSLNDFNLTKFLNKGAFGQVILAMHKATGNEYAMKKIDKKQVINYRMTNYLRLEVKIMYSLDHPNIIKLYNHFEDADNVYLVMELAEKGQLFDLIKKYKRLNDSEAVIYIRDLVLSLDYIHSLEKQVIHRDIKGENILLTKDNVLKLADFGWSNFREKDRLRTTYCGTPEYLAPELVEQKGYTEKVDIWSIGVLLYELLVGYTPFKPKKAKTREEWEFQLNQNIRKNRPDFPSNYPPLAKDLTQKLLEKNDKKRITLEDVKTHPWFESHKVAFPSPMKSVLEVNIDPNQQPDEKLDDEEGNNINLKDEEALMLLKAGSVFALNESKIDQKTAQKANQKLNASNLIKKKTFALNKDEKEQKIKLLQEDLKEKDIIISRQENTNKELKQDIVNMTENIRRLENSGNNIKDDQGNIYTMFDIRKFTEEQELSREVQERYESLKKELREYEEYKGKLKLEIGKNNALSEEKAKLETHTEALEEHQQNLEKIIRDEARQKDSSRLKFEAEKKELREQCDGYYKLQSEMKTDGNSGSTVLLRYQLEQVQKSYDQFMTALENTDKKGNEIDSLKISYHQLKTATYLNEERQKDVLVSLQRQSFSQLEDARESLRQEFNEKITQNDMHYKKLLDSNQEAIQKKNDEIFALKKALDDKTKGS